MSDHLAGRIEGTKSPPSLDIGRALRELRVDRPTLRGGIFILGWNPFWLDGDDPARCFELDLLANRKTGLPPDSGGNRDGSVFDRDRHGAYYLETAGLLSS